jgi:hypothetical protein
MQQYWRMRTWLFLVDFNALVGFSPELGSLKLRVIRPQTIKRDFGFTTTAMQSTLAGLHMV